MNLHQNQILSVCHLETSLHLYVWYFPQLCFGGYTQHGFQFDCILGEMETMTFYSLDELNAELWKRMEAENCVNFAKLSYSRRDLFEKEEKDALLPLPETQYEYLVRKKVTVGPDFSFTFDSVHYSMPRKYLKKQLKIRAGATKIYCDMMDELLRLSRENMTKYTKKLKYYARLRILFIDDFCISRYSEDGIKILYHLLKSRADLHYPTVFNTQYEPSEWSKWLSDDPGCFGKLDGIRRRLTTGFTVEIVKL